ncbi:unnamed protein product [Larinioides sclopetarius]|uniref:SOCS box domain-containing protein n=1 Tax=Larinioides sclopetarius TaxID=280406 RepID=A0AAV1YWF2_9ARAC
MAIYNEDYDSTYRCVELDDAKSIVKLSSIVHDSITYLDLNIGEYTNFKNRITTLSTDSARAFESGFPSKEAFESYSRTLFFVPFLKYDEEFHAQKFYVRELWFERKFQAFAILFIKRAEHKLTSLKKLNFEIEYKVRSRDSSFEICSRLNILCIERYDSDRIKGVLIALNVAFCDDDDFGEVSEYFLYHKCVSSGISLNPTADFGKDIIRQLMHDGFYRFVPQLLQRGFYLKAPVSEDNFFSSSGINLRRLDLAYYAYRLNPIVSLNNRDNYCDDSLTNLDGLEALTALWRSIPDVLFSQQEFAYINPRLLSTHSIEEIQSFYKRFAGDCPLYPEPRSLKHYCRLVVRNALASNQELPHGISELGMSPTLQSFLNLEC